MLGLIDATRWWGVGGEARQPAPSGSGGPAHHRAKDPARLNLS